MYGQVPFIELVYMWDIKYLVLVAYEGNISCCYIYDYTMVNKSCRLLVFALVCRVMWGLYVDHSAV